MAISAAQINWSGVVFTASGSPVPLKRITTGGFSLGGQLLKFKGDTDIYPSIIALVGLDPSITFGSADVGTFAGIVPGTAGTLVGTMNDAKAVTLGGVVVTGSNAVFETADAQGAHAAFSGVTASWQLFASDGLTPPLVLTRV